MLKELKCFGIATPTKSNLTEYELGDEFRFFSSKKAAEAYMESKKFPVLYIIVPLVIKLKV